MYMLDHFHIVVNCPAIQTTHCAMMNVIPCFVLDSGVLDSSLYRYEVWQGSGEREVERGREREREGEGGRGRGRKREGSPDVL